MIINKLYIKDEYLKYQYTNLDFKIINDKKHLYEFDLYNTIKINDTLKYYFEVKDVTQNHQLFQLIPFSKELISFNTWYNIKIDNINNKNIQFIFGMYHNDIYQYDIIIKLNLNIQIEIPINIQNDIEIDLILNKFKEKSLLKSLNYLFENNHNKNYNKYINILSCKKIISKYQIRLSIKNNNHYSGYYVNNLLKCFKFIKDNDSINYNKYYDNIHNHLYFLIDSLLDIENIYIYQDYPLINGMTLNISKKSHYYNISNLMNKKIYLDNNIVTNQNQKEIELLIHSNEDNNQIIFENLDIHYYSIDNNKINIYLDKSISNIDLNIINPIDKIFGTINIYKKDKYTLYTRLNNKTSNIESYNIISNILNNIDKKNTIIISILLLLFTEIIKKNFYTNDKTIDNNITELEKSYLNKSSFENTIFDLKKINNNISKYE